MIGEAQLQKRACLLPVRQPEKPDKAQNAMLGLDSGGLWLIQGAACQSSKAGNTPQPPAGAWGSWLYYFKWNLRLQRRHKGGGREIMYCGSRTIRKVEWHGVEPSNHRTITNISLLLSTVVMGTGKQENTFIMALLRRGNRNKADIETKNTASMQFLGILWTKGAHQLLKEMEKDTGEKHSPPRRRDREVSPGLLGFLEGNFSTHDALGAGGTSTGVHPMFNGPLFPCNLTDLRLDDRNLLMIAPKPPAAQQSGNWNKFLGRRAKRKSSLRNCGPNGPVLPSHSLRERKTSSSGGAGFSSLTFIWGE